MTASRTKAHVPIKKVSAVGNPSTLLYSFSHGVFTSQRGFCWKSPVHSRREAQSLRRSAPNGGQTSGLPACRVLEADLSLVLVDPTTSCRSGGEDTILPGNSPENHSQGTFCRCELSDVRIKARKDKTGAVRMI